MKYFKIIIILLMPLLVISCENKGSLKKKYIEACADGDFDKARKAAQKIAAINNDDADEAMAYVNDKEIYYLLAKPSRDNNSRILYLYNTYDESQLPDMSDVVDVAISMDNVELVEKLIKSGVETTTAVAIAAANNDLPEIFDMIITKNPYFLLNQEIASFYKQKKGVENYENILIEVYRQSILEEERQEILSIASAEGLDRIKKFVIESEKEQLGESLKELYSIKIPTRPALGIVKGHQEKLPMEYHNYKDCVGHLNKECTKLILKSIEYGDYNTANKALALMRPNLEWINLGDWEKVVEHSKFLSSYDAFRVSENRTEINEARRIIQSRKK